jgi:hypothetical protein
VDDVSLLDQIQVTGGEKRDASNRWAMARCCINTSNGRGRRKQATGGEQEASKGWRDARTEFEFRPTCLRKDPVQPAIYLNLKNHSADLTSHLVACTDQSVDPTNSGCIVAEPARSRRERERAGVVNKR